MPPPDQAVVAAIVELGRALRRRGLSTGMEQEVVLCRALGEIDVRSRHEVYWAARATFVRGPDDVAAFDAAFSRFWEGLPPDGGVPRAEQGESDPRMEGPRHGGESLPQFRRIGDGRALDGDASRASREVPGAPDDAARGGGRRRRGPLLAYSPDEAAADRERLGYADDELAAVRRLAAELRRARPERRSRRRRPSRRAGALDLRGTLRGSLGTDGEALRLTFAQRSRRPRRLVLVCDVSGSMERYTRALLGVLQGVAGSGPRAETFVFATRLTRLTTSLSSRDTAVAMERARAEVADWCGGTRIGAALAELNRVWGRRGFLRGSVVVIVSDGWDRGDPAMLAREVGRLRLQAHRLVWINPRSGDPGAQPLAMGMRAALPHVDDFIPGHDPRGLDALAGVIARLGAGRPARRQRAMAPDAGR